MHDTLYRSLRISVTVAVAAAAIVASVRLAQVDRAVEQLVRGDTAAQIDVRELRQLLRDRPLDGAVFRVLGDKSANDGDMESAAGFYHTAARREPRDPGVRAKLVDLHLTRGDIPAAVHNLDVLLRIAPDAGAPLLRGVLESDRPGLTDALTSRLALDPPWRKLLPDVLSPIVDIASAEELLAKLDRKSPLRPSELALRVSLLEQLGRPMDARNLWRAALPADLKRLDGLVFDGGFEYGPGPEPYGWRLDSPVGAAIGLDRPHKGRNSSSLVVLFDGRVVDFSGVSQDLVLKPGVYQLNLLSNLGLSESSRPFAWTIECRDLDVPVARMELPLRTDRWRSFALRFEVPVSCPKQRLSLVQDGRNLSERRLSGRMEFDSIGIEEIGK